MNCSCSDSFLIRRGRAARDDDEICKVKMRQVTIVGVCLFPAVSKGACNRGYRVRMPPSHTQPLKASRLWAWALQRVTDCMFRQLLSGPESQTRQTG